MCYFAGVITLLCNLCLLACNFRKIPFYCVFEICSLLVESICTQEVHRFSWKEFIDQKLIDSKSKVLSIPVFIWIDTFISYVLVRLTWNHIRFIESLNFCVSLKLFNSAEPFKWYETKVHLLKLVVTNAHTFWLQIDNLQFDFYIKWKLFG